MFDEFFQAVRDLNRSLPRERQLRILLGDPPMDWSAVKNADDYRNILLQRDSHPAELIRREVLAKGRRALVIYGDGHFQARTERPGRSLVGILETAAPSVFSVTSTYRRPLALPARCRLLADAGSGPARRERSSARRRTRCSSVRRHRLTTSRRTRTSRITSTPCWCSARLVAGAWAPWTIHAAPSLTTCEMRVGRMVLTGMPPTVADRLAQECAAAAAR